MLRGGKKVQYNISFEISGLLLLVVVLSYFIKTKNYSSLQNNLFALFVFVAILVNVFDIISVYTIRDAAAIPVIINQTVNSLYMMLQSLMPAMLFVYVLVLCGEYSQSNRRWVILMFPLIFVETVAITNVFTGLFFSFPNGVYQHGKLFFTMYIVCVFYFALSLLVATVYRKRIQKIEYATICVFLTLCALAIIIQSFMPNYLLSGLAVALSITMMYMTTQNTSARRDDLTGLNNRSGMLTYLKDRLSRRKNVNMIIFTVDEAKMLNNLFGAQSMSEFIVRLSDYLKCSMKRAALFRVDSYTFAVLCKSKSDCLDNLGYLSERFAEPFIVGSVEMKVAFCTCYMTDTGDKRDESELLELTEQILLKSRRFGKGRVIEITDSEISTLEKELKIESALYDAVNGDGLEVYFQPVYSTVKKCFIGAEALVRLKHETLGLIAPAEFIPIAESNGLIINVGQSVLEKVCRFIHDYDIVHKADYFEYIAINLSALELSQTNFPEKTLAMMRKYSVPPSYLMYEITGTIASTAYSTVHTNMQLMRENDISFALDDYGTGYANIDSMIRLPFSTIKLDREMLVRSFDDPKNNLIFESTINLIRDLGLKTIVEGAETLLQVMSLQELGVDNIQGYYYAHPMPMDEFASFMGLKDTWL